MFLTAVRPAPRAGRLRPATQVFLNGRFLSQRQTGVQRYARETLLELDKLLLAMPPEGRPRVCLLAPPGTTFPSLGAIETREVGRLTGQLWEQLVLPWAAREGLLWSFGPLGPLLVKNQAVTIHDATVCAVPDAFSWQFRSFYKLAMPLLVRRARRVMTVSEFSRGELTRYFSAESSSLRVSGEGWQHVRRVEPDPSVIATHQLVPGRYVLAVSSVTPHKNFAVIARAVARLGSTDVRVVIVGAKDEQVFGSIANLPSVTFTGFVSDAQLRALYEHAGVFVYPSLYEGFGLPPLEAMALGCPVLASNAASMPEVCGEGALYFAPHDDAELARLIERLLSNEDQRTLQIEKGAQQLARHSWEGAARKHLAAIEEALDEL